MGGLCSKSKERRRIKQEEKEDAERIRQEEEEVAKRIRQEEVQRATIECEQERQIENETRQKEIVCADEIERPKQLQPICNLEVKRNLQYETTLEQQISQEQKRLEATRLQQKQQLRIKTLRDKEARSKTPVRILPLSHATKVYTSYKIGGAEYDVVASKFRGTGKASMRIQRIEKIDNRFIKALYAQKRKQGHYVETELFHGTPAINVDSICAENFNYRVCGRGVGVRYGDGVSFTPFSYYASHYCDKGEDKVMFLCKVLVGNEQDGYKGMKVPQRGYDTSIKRNKRDPMKKDVYVKFDDDTFYPEYMITFKMRNYNNSNMNFSQY